MSSPGEPPPWYTACAEAIERWGRKQCPEQVCHEALIGEYIHDYCTCQPPWENGCSGSKPPPDCCERTQATPVPIVANQCYCCCGMASETGEPSLASSSGTYRPLREYQPGDPVYAADDATLESWQQRPVQWSGGVRTPAASLLEVRFGGWEPAGRLLMSLDQPFLTADGELVRARELVPGRHALVSRERDPRPVLSVAVPSRDAELRHVATTSQPASSPHGHLLIANGVVVGDWALQVGLLTASSTNTASGADCAQAGGPPEPARA